MNSEIASDPSSLHGRVAVVTGGAKGIGWATLEALMRHGAIPVLLDRDGHALGVATAALTVRGIDHMAQQIDVTDESAVDSPFAQVKAGTVASTSW